MFKAELLFWVCMGVVLYAYVVYPIVLRTLAALFPRRRKLSAIRPSVSIIIAAYNEELSIGRRVEEFLEMLSRESLDSELIIVSDGSTDGTASVARRHGNESGFGVPCLVVDLPSNGGKALALNAAVHEASKQILVFADARQTWARDALARLLENFADPGVGAVSGDLMIEPRQGANDGVGIYWKYEKWLRRQESEFRSSVGLTGAISAVRRELFAPVPAGLILDDVYWPLCVVMRGFRVVHDERAQAFDRLPERARDEFRRKVRTLSGNFQLVCQLPQSVIPWRNSLWWQFVSHKLCRLAVPWALLSALGLSVVLPGPIYRLALAGQATCYVLGLLGLSPSVASRFRPASAAASFLMLNAAAWMAFWVWAFGRTARSWAKTDYSEGQSPRSEMSGNNIAQPSNGALYPASVKS